MNIFKEKFFEMENIQLILCIAFDVQHIIKVKCSIATVPFLLQIYMITILFTVVFIYYHLLRVALIYLNSNIMEVGRKKTRKHRGKKNKLDRRVFTLTFLHFPTTSFTMSQLL